MALALAAQARARPRRSLPLTLDSLNTGTHMYKFGVIENGTEREHAYGNVWEIESTTGPKRMVIAPSSGHIELLQSLAAGWNDGYFLLYVLLVSCRGNRPGRYQSPGPLTAADVRAFCGEYGAYLETDGRHHFWIGSPTDQGTLVYDQHNVIFAYGDLASYERIATGRGLVQGHVRFPAPHTHQYNEGNDEREDAILSHWEWRWCALQDNDEY
jgi:hypothetical protein